MSNIKIRTLMPDEFKLWDELNRSSAQGSIFLSSDFLEMLCQTEDYFNHFKLLGSFDEEGSLHAGQAITFHKSIFSLSGHESYFRANGPILKNISNVPRASMVDEYNQFLVPLLEEVTHQFPGFNFDTHQSLKDLRIFQRLGWMVHLRYVHIWDLSESRDLLPRMRQGERKRIHRAERNYQFQLEQWRDCGEEFLKTHQESIQRHGWDPDERWNNLLSQRAQWMEDHHIFQVVTARGSDQQLVGGILTILGYAEKTAYLWFVGYQAEAAENGVVPALYNCAIQNLPPEILWVDMGKAEKPGLANFKDYLGTDLVPYYTVTAPNRFQLFKERTIAVGKQATRSIKLIIKREQKVN